MAFQTPITIVEALQNIHNKKYLLPAIQREFVWESFKVENLFDSILSGYPIGSFLFWSVSDESRRNYEFYEFIRDYHELHQRHNPKADVAGPQEITAILDGQQRLTALYIGLRGSYSSKIKWRRWSSDDAFPQKRLYLNLLERSKEFGRNFEFRFLTYKEAATDNAAQNGKHWLRAGQVLEFSTPNQVYQYLVHHNLGQSELAGELLFQFHSTITQAGLINFFLEQDQDFDKVLQIFIRVNSGGTPLSYSDLLLSVATAQWKSHDAREEINELVDELNLNGRFRFDKDFVLKSCLVLTDIGDIGFRVNNFNVKNTQLIESRWTGVVASLRLAVSLVASFGFTGQTLTSANAVIPIAYHLLRQERPANFVDSAAYKEERNAIRWWLLASLLSGAFGGQSDTVLSALRTTIAQASDQFPAEALAARLATLNRPLSLTPEQIDALLDAKYGQSHAFMILSTLYPWLDYRNLFHQDHIFPRSQFTKSRLAAASVPAEDIEFCLDNVDRLPNLQLLQGTPNQEKSNHSFRDWLETVYPTEQQRASYYETNLIPSDVPPILPRFRDFFTRRRELMAQRLTECLGRV